MRDQWPRPPGWWMQKRIVLISVMLMRAVRCETCVNEYLFSVLVSDPERRVKKNEWSMSLVGVHVFLSLVLVASL